MSNSEAAASSPWKWVDVDRHQEDPLPPVTEDDDRPAVKDLILKHSDTIQQVRANIKDHPLYDAKKHDDLWVLRFVLSQKKVKPATAAAISTLKYRQDKGYDERDIRGDWPGRTCSQEGVRKYWACLEEDALAFSIPHPDRGVALFVRFAGFDQHKLVEDLTLEEWPFSYCAEWTFQQLDSITRRTGRLTKSVRVVDLAGYRTNQMSRENINRDAADAKIFEDHYPQCLRSLFVCHAPTWLQVPFKLFRPLMPKRFIEKFNFINPSKNKKEAALFLKFMTVDHLPTRFGGNYKEWPVPARIEPAEH